MKDYNNNSVETNHIRENEANTSKGKIELAEKIFIGYPRFQNIVQMIEQCYEYSQISAEPECMLVTGTTGAGKTTLYKQFLKRYPRKITKDKTIVPVLITTIPAPATVKSVVEKLLADLGDPCSHKGSTSSQTNRLINFIKDCGVELIILDELQHFIDRDSNRIQNTVSDWLKTIIIETSIPMILFGMPESEKVIQANPQLSRRFSYREHLEPFKFKTTDDITEFRKFLFAIDSKLPFSQRSNLADIDMAFKIFYASDGVVGHVMKLIRKAVRISLQLGIDKLDIDILKAAFNLHIQKDKPNKLNPFAYNTFTEDTIKKLKA